MELFGLVLKIEWIKSILKKEMLDLEVFKPFFPFQKWLFVSKNGLKWRKTHKKLRFHGNKWTYLDFYGG